MDIIFNIAIAALILYGISNLISFNLRAKKERLEREILMKKLQAEQRRIIDEMVRRAAQANYNRSNYSKWNQLDTSVKDKILKVKTLVERGEGGEKTAAKSRFDALLLKNGITVTDVP